jgi:filamentous hemagglutinin family protein
MQAVTERDNKSASLPLKLFRARGLPLLLAMLAGRWMAARPDQRRRRSNCGAGSILAHALPRTPFFCAVPHGAASDASYTEFMKRAAFKRDTDPLRIRHVAWEMAAGLFLLSLASRSLYALPFGEQVTVGAATVERADSSLTINQSTKNVAINWQSFDVAASEAVRFNQPDAGSIALNRILGQDASNILGTLSSNGQVFILNPNGVLFGESAQISVGGMVASTLSMSDENFIAGRHVLTAGATAGEVVNKAAIVTAEGGYIALIAPQVRNEGTIDSPKGTVELAAGDKLTLTLGNGSLFGVTVDQGTLNALVENKQAIRANGGQVILSAVAVDSINRSAVNNTGIIEAGTFAEHDGVIRLEASTIHNSGTLAASQIDLLAANQVALESGSMLRASSGNDSGGRISITGATVGIAAATSMDSSADAGGGLIEVGGGWQGGGTLPHATTVNIASGATLLANATGSGDGGTIAIWSDGSTRVSGMLAARGAGSGNGGRIETSGHWLDVAGVTVDASSLRGAAGSWLLDPYNLTVSGAATTANETPPATWTADAGGGSVLNTDINAALNAGTSVVLQTSGALGDGAGNGDITVAAAIAKTAGANAGLTLKAAGSINIDAGISSTLGALAVTLNSNTLGGGGYVKVGQPITTNGGALVIGGGAIPLTGAAVGTAAQASGVLINYSGVLNAGGGDITINGAGRNTSSNSNFGINQLASISTTGAGNITLNGTGGGTGAFATGVVVNTHITAATGNIAITGKSSPTGTILSNHGVNVQGGTMSTAGTGTITLDGTADAATGVQSYGVVVQSVSGISTVRAEHGLISITGRNNATGSGIGNNGVYVKSPSSTIRSTGSGGITVLGFGGGTGSAGSDYGVYWDTANAMQSTGTGTIAITGTGGGVGGAGNGNYGVYAAGALTAISGPLAITGTGGGAGGTGGLNGGVNITAAIAGAGGAISITGTGGNARGPGNAGITHTAAITNTGTGAVTLNGTGGGTGIQATGILSNASITAGTGNLSLTGRASTTAIGSTNHGVQFSGGTRSTTGAGTITIVGTASGSGSGTNTYGVSVVSGAVITATDGLVDITGTNNSTGTGTGNHGVNITGIGSSIQSAGSGGVNVLGVGGGTGVSSSNAGVFWNGVNGIQATGTGAISITGTGGDMGGSGSGNHGVHGTSVITGGGGPVSITGTPSNSTGGANNGILADAVATGAGTLTLTSSGAVTGTGALTAAKLNLLGNGGSHVFTNGGNAVGTLAANTGSVDYAQSGNLVIGAVDGTTGVTVTGNALVKAIGDLTLASGVGVNGGGNALVLVAGGNFINSFGAAALSAPNGRWLVYSTSPAGSTENGVTATTGSALPRLYNRTYAANPPSGITEPGNHLIYSLQPTLTVTADGNTRPYGNANPAFTYTLGGFVVDDGVTDNATSAGVTGSPTLGSTATVTSNVASYPITTAPGSLSSATGYGLSFVAGVLTVAPRPITVTADDKERVYATANPVLTQQVTDGGLVNGDTLSGAVTTTATTSSNAGSYAITQGTISAGGNYALTFNNGVLTIRPRAITIIIDDQARVYGDNNPGLTYRITDGNLLNGDTLSGTATTTAVPSSNVGSYAITQGTINAGGNYALSFNNGTLTIGPRSIVVTIDGKSRIYGDANPELTHRITDGDLVNGDTLSGTAATTAIPSSNVGSYAITQGTINAGGNYALTFNNGTLTIGQRSITVTIDDKTRIYGDANPVLTQRVTSGTLVNGDTLLGTATSVATVTSNIGSYAIRSGSLTAGTNYVIHFVDGNLTVTPRAITISADNQTRSYGSENPEFTGRITSGSLINGDTVSGEATTTATPSSNVGAYAITQGTLSAGANYALIFSDGTLVIDKRSITVTANAETKIYGDPDPPLGYTSSDLGEGEPLEGNVVRTAGEDTGSYVINQGSITGATNSNYLITFVTLPSNALVITPRPLIIAADYVVKFAGAANPPLTATATGFVSGDGWDDLAGVLLIETSARLSSRVGSYPITVSGQSSTNYDITYEDGVMLINPREAPIVGHEDSIGAALVAVFAEICDVPVRGSCAPYLPGSEGQYRTNGGAPELFRIVGNGIRLPANVATEAQLFRLQ